MMFLFVLSGVSLIVTVLLWRVLRRDYEIRITIIPRAESSPVTAPDPRFNRYPITLPADPEEAAAYFNPEIEELAASVPAEAIAPIVPLEPEPVKHRRARHNGPVAID